MRIKFDQKPVLTMSLNRIGEGDPFMFESCLTQKHRPTDVFIRAEVCSTYRPRERGSCQYYGKIPVVNIRSGSLAYANEVRGVIPVNAEVVVE